MANRAGNLDELPIDTDVGQTGAHLLKQHIFVLGGTDWFIEGLDSPGEIFFESEDVIANELADRDDELCLIQSRVFGNDVGQHIMRKNTDEVFFAARGRHQSPDALWNCPTGRAFLALPKSMARLHSFRVWLQRRQVNRFAHRKKEK